MINQAGQMRLERLVSSTVIQPGINRFLEQRVHPPSCDASSVINRRDIFHVRSNFQVIIINVSLDSDSNVKVSHLSLSFFHVLTYYILRSIFLFFLIISSPRLPIFTTIKVFIHCHPLSILSIISRARKRGRRNTHGGMAVRNAHQEDRSPCARRQSVGAPWSNLIKYNQLRFAQIADRDRTR